MRISNSVRKVLAENTELQAEIRELRGQIIRQRQHIEELASRHAREIELLKRDKVHLQQSLCFAAERWRTVFHATPRRAS